MEKIYDVSVKCVQGDIAHQPDMDAVVNAANAALLPGGGVAGAIHRAAGPGLKEECRSMAPIRPGEAVITGAYNLPNKYVIHCLGPVYGRDHPEDAFLASCYREALRLADKNEITSIAFPAISAGIFGYPVEAAARIAIGTVLAEISGLSSVKCVRFVLFSEEVFCVFEKRLGAFAERGECNA